MKVIELDTSEPLSEKALTEALKRVESDPHDGWADLIVHQANLRPAMKLVSAHNLKKPQVKLRALCETRMGHDDWKLRTRTVELRVEKA